MGFLGTVAQAPKRKKTAKKAIIDLLIFATPFSRTARLRPSRPGRDRLSSDAILVRWAFWNGYDLKLPHKGDKVFLLLFTQPELEDQIEEFCRILQRQQPSIVQVGG